MSIPGDIRFFRRVSKAEGCWQWLGPKNNRGYGTFKHGRLKTYLAHRFSWEVAHGQPIPRGMYVCHSCDNRSCVNPEHLWLGTQRDNIRDASGKGRLRGMRQSKCLRGHVLEGANLLHGTNGGRHCRTCANALTFIRRKLRKCALANAASAAL